MFGACPGLCGAWPQRQRRASLRLPGRARRLAGVSASWQLVNGLWSLLLLFGLLLTALWVRRGPGHTAGIACWRLLAGGGRSSAAGWQRSCRCS